MALRFLCRLERITGLAVLAALPCGHREAFPLQTGKALRPCCHRSIARRSVRPCEVAIFRSFKSKAWRFVSFADWKGLLDSLSLQPCHVDIVKRFLCRLERHCSLAATGRLPGDRFVPARSPFFVPLNLRHGASFPLQTGKDYWTRCPCSLAMWTSRSVSFADWKGIAAHNCNSTPTRFMSLNKAFCCSFRSGFHRNV